MDKVTVKANTNIALVKYWGKRNEKLKLPLNNSISLTLDGLCTTTSVQFSENDEILFNNAEPTLKEKNKLISYLDMIRSKYNIIDRLKINTANNFPTAAGLASSASGYAALATALNEIFNLQLDKKQISVLARLGSGSASRSVYGGFSEWLKGENETGEDSYAVQIEDENYWDISMVVAVIDDQKKDKSSSDGMKETVNTSPFYKSWLDTVENDLKLVREGVISKDLEKVGMTMEHNCLKMHSTMFTTLPAIIYWKPASLEVISAVYEMRREGIPCYFTMDAGPNVKILCLSADTSKIVGRLKGFSSVKQAVVASPGQAPELTGNVTF